MLIERELENEWQTRDATELENVHFHCGFVVVAGGDTRIDRQTGTKREIPERGNRDKIKTGQCRFGQFGGRFLAFFVFFMWIKSEPKTGPKNYLEINFRYLQKHAFSSGQTHKRPLDQKRPGLEF